MNILNIEEDSINRAMVDGLLNAFEEELKEEFRIVSEEKINKVVKTLSERLELKLNSNKDFDTQSHHIKLQWFLRREKS